MNRATWSVLALADLDELDTYFRELSPDYSKRVGRTAIAAARFLANHPLAGPPLTFGLRKWPVKGTYYIMLYRTNPTGIEVARLIHARRDWRPQR